MDPRFILTIDLGSSSCKICLWNERGELQCRERVYYIPERTPDGGVEMDPEILWNSAVRGIRGLLAGGSVAKDSIALVVPIGHITTLIFLDAKRRVLRPALLYSDRRAWKEAEELYALFPQAELDAAYGFHLPASPSWPLPRLLWISRHEPATMDRTEVILQPKDYIRFRMTGEISADPDSSRGLVNYATGKPDSRIYGILGLPVHCFAPVYPPRAIVGAVSAAAAGETGLSAGTPVLNGWNDFNAAVYGCGITSEATGFDITGTTEHVGCRVFGPGRGSAADERLVHAPFDNTGMLFYGASLASGGSLSWFAENFSPAGKPGGEECSTVLSYQPWMECIRETEPGAKGLIYLPYLDGERAPVWDPNARAAFIGLSSGHTWRDMLRALLEGVGAGLCQIFRLTQNIQKVSTLRITGGYAEHELWNRIKASFFNVPLAVLETDEAAGLGGAMLGALALGWHSDYFSAAAEMVRIRSVTEPVREWVSVYRERQEIFDRLYPLLKETFGQL